jgi:hypothetical protein
MSWPAGIELMKRNRRKAIPLLHVIRGSVGAPCVRLLPFHNLILAGFLITDNSFSNQPLFCLWLMIVFVNIYDLIQAESFADIVCSKTQVAIFAHPLFL